MSYLSELLNISPGDVTEIREITAPTLGDNYIDSYYDILATVEKNTVHFAETQGELPEPENYDDLLGIAQTVRNDSSQQTLHYYDGTEWIDTFDSNVIGNIESDISSIEDDIGFWNPNNTEKPTIAATLGYVSDSNANIATRVRTNESDIGDVSNITASNLSSQVSTNESDIGSVGSTDLQTQVNNNDSDISTINSDIGSVGSTDLQTQVNNNDSDISTINSDIGSVGSTDLQTQINNNDSDISTINDDIGSVGSTDLQTQISNNDTDIGDMSQVSAGDLATQVSTNDADIGDMSQVSAGDLATQVSTNESDIDNINHTDIFGNEGYEFHHEHQYLTYVRLEDEFFLAESPIATADWEISSEWSAAKVIIKGDLDKLTNKNFDRYLTVTVDSETGSSYVSNVDHSNNTFTFEIISQKTDINIDMHVTCAGWIIP